MSDSACIWGISNSFFCDFYVFQNLPASVKRRIKALKKVQLETTMLEAKFYEEVHLLECKYHKLYTPLYEKVWILTIQFYNICHGFVNTFPCQ